MTVVDTHICSRVRWLRNAVNARPYSTLPVGRAAVPCTGPGIRHSTEATKDTVRLDFCWVHGLLGCAKCRLRPHARLHT